MESVVVALVSGGLTMIGTIVSVLIANNKQSAVLVQRIDTLDKRVEKHNTVIERVYKLEEQPDKCEEKFKTLFNDLERMGRG